MVMPPKRVQTFADLGMKVDMPGVAPAPTGKQPKPRKMVKEGLADRGKFAEKETGKVLEGWNRLAAFAYERIQDARAVRGISKAQISDYMVWYKHPSAGPLCIPLEVKSTAHKTRKGSYLLGADAITQLPRLNKAQAAGCFPFVLVYFKASDRWRVAPVHFFVYGVSSWDMSALPEFPTAKAALQSTGFFPVTD